MKHVINTGLIIGAGSVGCKHIQICERLFDKIYVVDISDDALSKVREDFKGVITASSIEEISREIEPNCTLAIIANWGVDHFNTFHELISIGIGSILCEKPLAHSIDNIRVMNKLSLDNDIDLRVNHHRRFTNIDEQIRNAFGQHGESCNGVVVHGGAQCMVTNGIHWLDLCVSVFDEMPVNVIANLRDSRINPRSKDLGFWEGASHWMFGGDKMCTMSFSNQSSVSAMLHFYSENSRLDYVPGVGGYFGRRESIEIEKNPSVTRTGRIDSELLFKDPSTFNVSEEIIKEMIAGENRRSFLNEHVLITQALLAALYSSKSSAMVTLPMTSKIYDLTQEWNVS